MGYDVVDNGHFDRGASRARATKDVRVGLGLPPRFFLTSGRFVAKRICSACSMPMRAIVLLRERRPGIFGDQGALPTAWHERSLSLFKRGPAR